MRFFIQGFCNLEWFADLKSLTEYEFYESVAPSEPELRARSRFAYELDYAYFAARLGWTPEQYESLTPIQRLFVRKELETVTVNKTNIMQDAMRLSIVNAHNGKTYRVFARAVARDETITDEDVSALVAAYKENPPWVPWRVNG